MEQFTLNDFYNRLDYLTEKGTLEELLAFLEVQCVRGSEKDIYTLANTNLLVFDVLHSEAKVRFQAFSPKGDSKEMVEDFFVTLFDQHRELLARLVDLLKEEYSNLGSLTFEEQYRHKCYSFKVSRHAKGWVLHYA